MKLLIIEDDEAFARTLARRLSNKGFECFVSHNSESAFLMAKQHRPSHVLIDLKLADESGLALISPLRSLLADATIVLLTGYASIATAVQAMRFGADDYLAKPVDFSALVKTLLQQPDSQDTQTDEIPLEVMSAERLEWEHIQQVLQSNDGNISETARQLNMHRRTLQRKLQKKPVIK